MNDARIADSSDGELQLMQTLQLTIEGFGPKTSAQVVAAVQSIILATQGVEDVAVERALAWIVTRTEQRAAAEEAKRKRTPAATEKPVDPAAVAAHNWPEPDAGLDSGDVGLLDSVAALPDPAS